MMISHAKSEVEKNEQQDCLSESNHRLKASNDQAAEHLNGELRIIKPLMLHFKKQIFMIENFFV